MVPPDSHTGRPSIDPELMIRMLIVGYAYGIRSERRLCEEVQLNLAYRWFCQLSIEDEVPDHSTFSKIRFNGRIGRRGECRHRQRNRGGDGTGKGGAAGDGVHVRLPFLLR
jgi:transposase